MKPPELLFGIFVAVTAVVRAEPSTTPGTAKAAERARQLKVSFEFYAQPGKANSFSFTVKVASAGSGAE